MTEVKTTDDTKALIVTYVTDMLALEKHIHQALVGQLKSLDESPFRAQLSRAESVCEKHIDVLTRWSEKHEQTGQGVSKAVKTVVSSVLGAGASIVDMIRSEELPKDLRDDYTAVSLACIGYVMLNTTALALGESDVAAIAELHLADHAQLSMALTHAIPHAVIATLKEKGYAADESVLPTVDDIIHRAWQPEDRAVRDAEAAHASLSN